MFSFPIPSCQSVDGCGVAQIVQSRLEACAVSTADASLSAKSSKRPPKEVVRYACAEFGDEERSVLFLRMAGRRSLPGISQHRFIQVASQRCQPRLVALRIANGRERLRQVDVGERPGTARTRTQRVSVHAEKDRPT